MPVQKSCVRCGSQFEVPPSKSHREHCGRECAAKTAGETRRLPVSTTPCEVCEADIEYRQENEKRRFCSPECLAEWRTGREPGNKLPRITKRCEECGKGYRVPDGKVGKGRRFCSQECSNRYRAGRPRPETRSREVLECQGCGDTFEVWPSRAREAKYCSRECSAAAKSRITGRDHPLWDRVERTCQTCDETFYEKPSKVEAGEGKYCSRECLGASIASKIGRASQQEVTFRMMLSAHGISGEPNAQVGQWCVDLLFPDQRVVVEFDGDYWHDKPEVQERDERKNHQLAEQGYTVVRVRESLFRDDPYEAVSRVRAAL